MINVTEKKQCCGCSACYSVCPRNAIAMKEDDKGFKYPFVDREKCIDCNLCVKVCPIINNRAIENNPKAYICINKSEKIRKESSSGGIFTLLAEEVIDMKGVVFGAAFDENFNVIHKGIQNIKDIKELRGSKYVQSDIGETYKQAKMFLEQNKYVLFTGTPCQIEGLQKFLGKSYDKLYTQDFICHGVPSKKIWQKYLNFMQKDKEKLIKTINFRNKKHSWENYSMNIVYNDKNIYNKEHNKDLYMRAFLQDISLRESCYNCQFKKYNRNSDITLADFWGISKIRPQMNDHKGISLVIINSNKGDILLEKIKNKCIMEEINLKEAIKYNKSFITSAKYNKNRESFFEDIDKGTDFKKVIKKYTINPTLARKIINKCKNNIKKLLYK